jgi:hypothetical protein
MQIDDDELGVISIGPMEVEQLLPEAKEHIKQKALIDENYMVICKQLSSGGNVSKEFPLNSDNGTSISYMNSCLGVTLGLVT